jgi:hypothetical protein
MILSIYKFFLLSISALFISAHSGLVSADPMDDVFSMLGQGGTRSGVNALDGYYVVAMGTSNYSSESKGKEQARLDALRQLNEMINGVKTSGSTEVSMKYVTISDGTNKQEFSKERFVDVINHSFNGYLSAVKMLKSGQYNGDYFVVLVITERDVAKIVSLRTQPISSDSSGISSQVSTVTIAKFSDSAASVEAKGLASMKKGESIARELAVQDAIKNAVQQAQGVMISGKSGQFNEAVAIAISTKTEGYVSSYEILDEDIERGQYYVVIAADVNKGQLISDANFYLDIFGDAKFSISSTNRDKVDWLTDELEKLGFSLSNNQASHTFTLSQSQRPVEDHKGSKGIETTVTIQLVHNASGAIILTIVNTPIKSRIYIKPESRAKQVSEHQAHKQITEKLGLEVIQSLAAHAERGVVYPIFIRNANRNDVAIFKHILENSTNGTVENWKWNKKNKTMVLNYRFSGSLSQAFDQGLDELYQTFKLEGKGRRPYLKLVNNQQANFEIR